mmetsp:Transcript_9415/g.26019  ORF Transcript_9415/g.26019 Transcript_9415/m.26019 type:complete len:257 (-) Transcript_9415:2602-3372(-)
MDDSSYTLEDLMAEYDAKLTRLNKTSSSHNDDDDLMIDLSSDSAVALGMIKDLEQLLLVTTLLLQTAVVMVEKKKNEDETENDTNGPFESSLFSDPQQETLQQTVQRCRTLIQIIQETHLSDGNEEEEEERYQSPWLDNEENDYGLHISSVGNGRYVYSWKHDHDNDGTTREIDLSGAHLEEEEAALMAMANTPIPNETAIHNHNNNNNHNTNNSGTEATTTMGKANSSSWTRELLRAAWGEKEYQAAVQKMEQQQ